MPRRLHSPIFAEQTSFMADFLRAHIEQLVPLTDEEFAIVAHHYSLKKLRKRQFLIQEQQMVDHIYLVQQGLLKTAHIDDSGREHILQFAAEHWWVSDFAAFHKRQPASLSIEAVENTEVWAVSFDSLNMLCSQFHKLEHFHRVKADFGYIGLQQRLLSMMNQSARERYAHFAQQFPQLLQRLPKQLIASYLGVSRETLSRISL